MIRIFRKCCDLARVECALWSSRDMSLWHKVLFAISRVKVLAGANSVIWLGHPMKSDNPLGLLLLPEYLQEARRLASVARVTSQDIVIDVGGNIGQFATSMVAVTGCKVISIEADPGIASILRANSHSWPLITVVQAAVGACADTKAYFSIAGKSAQGSFDPKRAMENLSGVLQEKRLSVVPLASVIDQLGLLGNQVACIKIDTEGTELDVLAGCAGLSPNAIQVEIDTREPDRNARIQSLVGSLLGREPQMHLEGDVKERIVQNAIFI